MITGMNHAVLYVRDARRQQRFYDEVLGFETIVADPNGAFVFLRAPGSGNHHDLACFTIGSDAGRFQAGGAQVGLYHLAWEVPTLDDLDDHRRRLADAGSPPGASDHGVNKSLYAHDPDGIEFEVMWLVPPEEWGDAEHQAIVRPARPGRRRRSLRWRPLVDHAPFGVAATGPRLQHSASDTAATTEHTQ